MTARPWGGGRRCRRPPSQRRARRWWPPSAALPRRTGSARSRAQAAPGLAAAALAADRAVATAPTRPALDRYAGVVYAALDAGSLTAGARRRAEEQVLVLSGLWGVVRGGDPVPDYRVPASGSVPGLGPVAAHWRRAAGRGAARAGR